MTNNSLFLSIIAAKDPPSEQEVQRNLESVKLIKQKAQEAFERDLDKFPNYAEKLKKAGDVKVEEEKKNFPTYKDLLN